MWTPEQRGRMARVPRKTKRYPSDMTDEEWERIVRLMPGPGRRGCSREVEFREVINAVRHLVRSGCGWRMLPIHFRDWRRIYGWFRELPRRWVVERTFGWMTRWRRLVRDYERRIDVSHAMIFVAMGANLMRRNAHP
ncbi:transposase [Gluconobacter oxydans]|uniref:transposase n=1 Tax=Gluconobacter oxydans TaxID=442 RepID=UPI0039E7FE20